jgi:hypothetical protein
VTETEQAVILANKILDRVNADPDDDLAVLARQFLRALERPLAAVQIYSAATTLAMNNRQIAGEDHSYFVTLRQLQSLILQFSPAPHCTPSAPPRSNPDRPS